MPVIEGAGSGTKKKTLNVYRPPAGPSPQRTYGPSPNAVDSTRANTSANATVSPTGGYDGRSNSTAAEANAWMRAQNETNQFERWFNNGGSGSSSGGSSSGGGGSSYGGGGGWGGGGGSGGGGGVPQIDNAALLGLLNRQPQQFQPGEQYSWESAGPGGQFQWQDNELAQWNSPDFYDFDSSMYDTMQGGVREGIAADRASGMASYGDARTELAQYQNPFAGGGTSQNQPMDAAMQRMLAANGVSADQATMDQGVQADSAFGNVMALLGANAGQRQDQQMRALGGDERRFNESLDSQGRTMDLSIQMRRQKAMAEYEQNKFKYGADVARQMFEDATTNSMYNNQGRNQTSQANTAANNERSLYDNQGRNQTNQANVAQNNQTSQANTQLANDYNSQNIQTMIDLLANGQKLDPAWVREWQAQAAAPASAAPPASTSGTTPKRTSRSAGSYSGGNLSIGKAT